jgi:hypothetical protein
MASADYTKAVQRGRILLTEIDKSPSNTTPSAFTNFASLASANWRQQHYGNNKRFRKGVDKEIPLPETNPHHDKDIQGSEIITWKHSANAGAYYTQYYHPAGAIFATSLRSPGMAPLREDQSEREPVPKLQHWSDVTFLQWAVFTGDFPTMRNLKMVVHCNVSNTETLKVINEVLGEVKDGLLVHPGRVFTRERGGDDFAALLGTPNGMGTGYLLAQHKHEDQLGWKGVESVTVYKEDVSWYLVVNIGRKA